MKNHLIATKDRPGRNWPGGPSLPTFQIVRGYAREMRRVHPNWSLHECVMEGYTLAIEAMNPKENYR